MQKSYLVQNITSIRAVLIVRCSLYVCSVCVPPDFVVQINNFFSLVLFSTTIHEWRGKKLISKTIEYKLDSSSKMQWCNLNLKKFRKVFWKTIDFVENLGMTLRTGSRGSCSLPLLWRNTYKNQYTIHPLQYQVSNNFHFLETIIRVQIVKLRLIDVHLTLKILGDYKRSYLLKQTCSFL